MTNWEKWVVGAAFVFCMLFAWFAGTWLSLRGSNLWILRGGLAAFSIAGLGAFLSWRHRLATNPPAQGSGNDANSPAGGDADEIDSFIAEAQANLGHKLAVSPAILLVGQRGSGKTSIVTQSGLEAQALAGQESATTPSETGHSNAWISSGTLFVEPAPQLWTDQKRWSRLVRHLAEGRFRSLFRRRVEVSRSAIVCMSCSDLATLEAAQSLAAVAQSIRKRLKDACNVLGVDIPVYVLFTNADRLKFFDEYANNLTEEESGRPMGVTLAMDQSPRGVVWSDWQSKRLKLGLDELFHSLSDRRLELLSLESDQGRRRGIYQFPREFRKLRQHGAIIQFLVEICRPYQLGTAPFLRGFYFTGVREKEVSAASPEMRTNQPIVPEDTDLSVTRMVIGGLVAQHTSQSLSVPRQSVQKRRRWIFISRLLNEVIMLDRVAMGASSSNTRLNIFRRWALVATITVLACMAAFTALSYSGNRRLMTTLSTASRALPSIDLKPLESISRDSLDQLEQIRLLLDQLGRWRSGQERVPWSLRWGLYIGDDLYAEARKTYFDRFGRLMLSPVQARLKQRLRSYPPAPGPTDIFSIPYETLKAYLITTAWPEKSTQAFLSPVLMKWWEAGRTIDPELRKLAQLQFDFYSRELQVNPPYPRRPEDENVEHARVYLKNFSFGDRAYQAMMDSAARAANNQAINFNRLFPGSEESIVDKYEVPAQFTKSGWQSMQTAFKNPSSYYPIGTEDWVVVLSKVAGADAPNGLVERYQDAFVNHWSEYLRNAHVVACRHPNEAARKLELISSNPFPLHSLLCLASQNTAVDSPRVRSTFKPVETVVPPDCSRDASSEYVGALFTLQQALKEGTTPSNQPDSHPQIAPEVRAARTAVNHLEFKFGSAPESQKVGGAVKRLLSDPINNAETCMPTGGGGDVTTVCTAFHNLRSKYPFTQNGTPVSLKELDAFFSPGGTLWKFYDQNLKSIVTRRGGQYVVNTTGSPVPAGFLRFLDKAEEIKAILYKDGRQNASLQYSVYAYPVGGVKGVTLSADGIKFTYILAREDSHEYVWPGTSQGAELLAQLEGVIQPPPVPYKGVWGVFKMFGEMTSDPTPGPPQILEWPLRLKETGEPFRNNNGSIVALRFSIKADDPSVFRPRFWSGLACISK